MNVIMIKKLAIISALAGAVLGFITLIPFVGLFSFLTAFVFLSAIILVYMKRNDLIGILSLQEGAIYGAVIGIVSFSIYLIILAPIAAVIGLLFKGYPLAFFGYLFNNIGSFFFSTIPLAIFTILMSALFNGFVGMVTAWCYQLITGIKKENNQNSSVDFEIK
ncbi:hypothetical protein IJ750_00645 [bacterium]|nr:hypothetical protein [bacterium]